MARLRYDTLYSDRGHVVRVRPGARLRSISSGYGYGELIEVEPAPGYPRTTTLDRWEVEANRLIPLSELELRALDGDR